MNEGRYSSMSPYELQQEIAMLHEKARKAEQIGMVNELQFRTKINYGQNLLIKSRRF